MTQKVHCLLYTDEQGEEVGLDEVQLLDPPPVERIPKLRKLLQESDEYVAYQAALILAAWGDELGLKKLEEFVDTRIHERGEFSPHRMGGEDNVYDEIADAVHLYGLSGGLVEARERLFRKLLGLYGPCFFESRLKHALLKSDLRGLIPDVREAIERGLALGQAYMASQLLPVLVRWESEQIQQFIHVFMDLPPQTPNPLVNVAEALGYARTPESQSLLLRLLRSSDEVVAKQAQESLEKLSKKR